MGEYLKPPRPLKSKEETIKEAIALISGGFFREGTAAERMLERLEELRNKTIWRWNYEASFMPPHITPDMKYNSQIDDRLKDYRGRYGAVLSD